MHIPNPLSRLSAWSLAWCILSLSNSFNGAIADELRVIDAQLIGESSYEVTARIPSGFDHAVLEVWTGHGPWLIQIAGSLDKAQAGTAVFRLPRHVGGSSAMARVRCGQGTSPTAALSDASLFSITYDAAGDVVPEPIKFDNLDRLMEKRSEWQSLSLAQRNANLQTFALTLPGVSSAGYSSLANTFYLKYTDGDASLLLDDRGGPRTSPLPPPELNDTFTPGVFDHDRLLAAPRRRETRDADSVPEFLPQSQDALCVYSLQPEIFPDATPQIQRWLNQSGYSVTRQVAPTVTDVMGWSGRRFGVVFWQTHAGSLLADDLKQEFMCVVAGERASIAKSQNEYRTLRSGPSWELLICGVTDPSDPARKKQIPFYALTPKFLQTRLNGLFADHSLFAFDACTGAHPDLANIFFGAWRWRARELELTLRHRKCRQL